MKCSVAGKMVWIIDYRPSRMLVPNRHCTGSHFSVGYFLTLEGVSSPTWHSLTSPPAFTQLALGDTHCQVYKCPFL